MKRGLLTAVALALSTLLLPQDAAAQWSRPGDDDPAIAAARQAVFDAPWDEAPFYSDKLLALIKARFGKDSPEYTAELQLHASYLMRGERTSEAQKILVDVVEATTRIHGAESQETAFARRDLAQAMRINGFTLDAVDHYAFFLDHMVGVALGCGMVEGMFIRGCSHNISTVSNWIESYANLLHDVGRTEDGAAKFEEVLGRFEQRWAACETEALDLECSEVAEERQAILDNQASFYETIGAGNRALDIRRAALLPMLRKAADCTDDSCRVDYSLVSAYREYRDLLGEDGSQSGVREFDAEWLPLLVSSEAYAAGAAEDASYSDRSLRETIDELVDAYAQSAAQAGWQDKDRRAFAAMDLEHKIDAVGAELDVEARLAALDQQIYDVDYAGRAEIHLQRAALFAERDGEASEKRAEALRDAGFAFRLGDRRELATQYFRQSYDIYVNTFGHGNFRTWTAAEYLSHHLGTTGKEDEALEVLSEIVLHPDNDLREFYADPIKRGSLRAGFMDPNGNLHDLAASFTELRLKRGDVDADTLRVIDQAAFGKRAYREALSFSYRDEQRMQMDQSNLLAGFGNRSYADWFVLQADALWAANSGPGGSEGEGLLALQLASMGSTSGAVARAAAERAASKAGAQDLLAQREEIDRQIANIEAADSLVGPQGSPVTDRIAQMDAERRDARVRLGLPVELDGEAERQRASRQQYNRVAQLRFQRDDIDRQIREASPGYFELVRPQPLTADEATALLGSEEAFLLVVPSEFGVHSISVSQDGVVWHRAEINEEQLNAHVRRLLWDLGANVNVTEDEDAIWSNEGEGSFPFDRARAHLLYKQLVEPHAANIGNREHLFVAATGSLSSMPFSVLVTEPPSGADGDPAVLRATPWLADRHAIVQLPSLQSLELLRAVDDPDQLLEDAQVMGFGDPVLAGEAVTRGTSPGRRRPLARGIPVSAGFRATAGEQTLANVEAIRNLARLPGTRTELLAMQEVFGDENVSLFLGDEATERQLRSTDLSQVRVLSIATHGLLAGEIEGAAEPGLVFTPPSEATAQDDGLLTASEVTLLELGADWVILSACNTAAGDGSDGAPGLSGLARSFFFAGAESLLASHWPVQDEVAALMTGRLLTLQRDNPDWSRAKALQVAMREIREDERKDGADFSTWAHPSAWAPFTYIGDVR
ncbi:CHAT domain-containing protein [Erythrobacter sp. HKB08]|uniref:CHAT domain-containing protein n=1 Tax=Erythrobacter sp. HKB08 TaxID=2502843 RepID=UPI001008A2EF|nr:CHAT domain-containing protein [Erythrobacter sp. HKB08]